MKTLVTLAFCFFGMIADAQSLVDYSWQFAPTNSANNNLMIDLAGSPLKVKKKADVDGSPFFKEDYCDATYYGADGRIYRGIASKLNLQTNTISFLRQEENEEKEYTPSFQIKKIVFTGCTDKTGPVVFQLGFPAIGIQSDNSYYQVLDSGKTMLLKFSQVIETANPVNGLTQSGGTTSLQKIDIYYIYSPDKGIVKVSTKSEEVLKLLADKRLQLDNYITTNNIRIRKESDLLKVVQYYNSLN